MVTWASSADLDTSIRAAGGSVPHLDVLAPIEEMDRLLASPLSPRRRRMLSIVRDHTLLELAGRWSDILASPTVRPDLEYILKASGPAPVRGDALREYYRDWVAAGRNLVEVSDLGVLLGDLGIISRFSVVGYVATEQARQWRPGVVAESEPAPCYRFRSRAIEFWTFDESATLVGRRGGPYGPLELTPAAPEAVPTQADVSALVQPRLGSVPDFEPDPQQPPLTL